MRLEAAQMEAFRTGALRSYAPRMVEHLRQHLPKKAARFTDDELEVLVLAGVERARGYGLVLKAEVAQYLYLMLILGPDFDADPRYDEIQRVLMRRDVDAETRLNHVFTLLLT